MKKLLILLLVIGVGSLTSCGKKGGSEGGAPTENTATETTNEAPATEPAKTDSAPPADAAPKPKEEGKGGGH
jgi:hypothetical protein